jgi:carbonic anhydrase
MVYRNIIPHNETTITLTIASFSLTSLLPTSLKYYNYQGSLTTPTCDQGGLASLCPRVMLCM